VREVFEVGVRDRVVVHERVHRGLEAERFVPVELRGGGAEAGAPEQMCGEIA
jgi:hypothetical protein